MKHFPTTVLMATFLVSFGLTVDAAAQKRVSCGPDVLVTVTIDGTYPGATIGLVSDGLGDYRNASKGSNKITAIFQVDNCTHDFTMGVGFSQRSMYAVLVDPSGNIELVKQAVFFNFDRVHSVPLTPVEVYTPAAATAWLTSAFCANGIVRDADGRVHANGDGTYQDNYAGCGVDDQGRAFVRRAGGVSLEDDGEKLSFQRSPLDQQNPPPCPENPICTTSFLRVYHPDATTWVVRPEPEATAVHRVWTTGNPGGYVFLGYRTVPFEITARKQ